MLIIDRLVALIIIFLSLFISFFYIVISWRRSMRSNWHKALLVSFVLITSSLAGCLNNDEDDDKEENKQQDAEGEGFLHQENAEQSQGV